LIKLFVIYLSILLFSNQFCFSQQIQDEKQIEQRTITIADLDCDACSDKILMDLKNKDTLTLEEKKVYAALQYNCEICRASNKQAAALREQTKLMEFKSNASYPLWYISAILTIVSFFTIMKN